jgi:hypothetical protein
MLYTFRRSQAAFRARIALNLFKPEHRAQNPSPVVPTLYNGNAKLVHLATLWFGQSPPGRQILQARMLAR